MSEDTEVITDTEVEGRGSEDCSEYQPVEPKEFETLDLTLEEARRRFDNEELRRDAVEAKIGTVVTVDALIISFVGVFSELHPLLVLVVLLPAIASAAIGLVGIRSQEYEKPGFDITDFHEYAKMEKLNQKEHFLLAYEVATDTNRNKNSLKFRIFNYCIGYTFSSLMLVLVSPLATQAGITSYLVNLPKGALYQIGGAIVVIVFAGPPLFIWCVRNLNEKIS